MSPNPAQTHSSSPRTSLLLASAWRNLRDRAPCQVYDLTLQIHCGLIAAHRPAGPMGDYPLPPGSSTLTVKSQQPTTEISDAQH